jgi:phenylacetate-CoA ligase
MYFSGGTTGKPRPTVFTTWDRVAGALIGARGLFLQGYTPGDIVLNSWAYGTHDAAWSWDDCSWWWTGCLPITVGTGNVTGSVQQLEFAKDYGAASILASSDYLLHLKATADKQGFSRDDFKLKYFQTIGDVQAVTKAWGVPAYEVYAFHEVKCIAAECQSRGGLHVWDDAFILEIVDPETGKVLPPGELGDLVITCLYKTGSPQIRYNIKDLSRLHYGTCECGSESTRMESLAGRSDTMVKLRGINVWPEAIGSILVEVANAHVEYFCIAYKESNREEMLVLLEKPATISDEIVKVSEQSEKALQSRLDVKFNVKVLPEGGLDELTGKGKVAKLRRFLDERAKGDKSEVIKRYLGN